MNDFFLKLKSICETKQNEKLIYYSNMHCGGVAQFMCFPKNVKEIKKTIKLLIAQKQKFFILGNGTNVLFCGNFNGVIVNLKSFNKIKIKNNVAFCNAGASLTKLNYLLKINSLKNFEWSYGIPGTVGGALYMNAGAFNGEISNFVIYAICYDSHTKKIIKIKKGEMQFGYRQSIFQFDRYIILNVKLKFKKGSFEQIEYLQKTFLEKRKQSQPILSFNLGSIFKKVGSVSAGKVIEDLKLKGKKIGGAYISKIHGNFIVNDGTAIAKDVLDLIEYIKNNAKEKLGIYLQTEIKIVNSD